MAVTKILARNARLDAAINYVINGDKTEDHILTAYRSRLLQVGNDCDKSADRNTILGRGQTALFQAHKKEANERTA